ncbi:MAG: YitT family protein [Parasporobacterium sp.]|nr:YitT family protein [Parasporobacterium sp.]
MAKNHCSGFLIKYVFITLGSVIYALGISIFLDPNNLAPGGITGIAVILNRIIPLSTGTLILLLNIPGAVFGIIKFGWRFMVSTVYSVVIISLFTNLFSYIGPVTDDMFVAALAGGIIQGIGLGLVFRFDATTGGTDIYVKALRQRYRHIKTGIIFLITDVVIVIASGFVFRDINIVFYALLVVAVSGMAMNFVLYGSDEENVMFIISDNARSISQRIMNDVDLGLTYLNGKGAYTEQDKTVLMCAMRKNLTPVVEDIVREEDKNAFVIISSAKEIYGEGHKNILKEKI